MTSFVYTLSLDHPQRTHRFVVDVERGAPPADAPLPPWAALGFHRCPSCPLDPQQHPGCPPAVDLVPIIQAFADADSVEDVDVCVSSEQREYRRQCDLQMALRSLMGLVMGSSACPAFAHLRGMARFHLPFASRAETAWRLVATWMLSQHLQQGTPTSLEPLRQHYAQLREINIAFAARLRAASRRDAPVNAIAALSSLSSLVAFSLDDDLEEIRRFLLPTPAPDR